MDKGHKLLAWRAARAELFATEQAHAANPMPGANATPAEIDAWITEHEAVRIARAHLCWLAAEIDPPLVGENPAWHRVSWTHENDTTVGLGGYSYARLGAQARALELRAIGYRSQVVARDCGFDVYAWTDFEGAQIAQSQSPLKPVDWRKAKTVRIYKHAPAQTR